MDSEQIVSNPYQELHTEALDSVKKASLTERLTSVRNNVCEHHLRTETSHLEKQRTHSLRNLHMDTSNLRYQVKVMDIHKRKNDLAMQQRLLPSKDFSYDHHQISISAKRLGVSSEESFYLNKKLQYPLRGNITRDHNSKPFIRKARQAMANHTFNKKQEQRERSQTAHTFERAPTAQTMSTNVEIVSPEPQTSKTYDRSARRGSKSAPPTAKPSAGEPKMSNTKLPTVIDVPDAGKLPDITTPSVATMSNHPKSHVKFQVEKPPPFRQSTPNKLQRSKTFYSGMTRKPRTYSNAWDTDSDEDDYVYTEKVDLRALFFGDKSQSSENKSAITGSTTPRTVFTTMSGEIPLPHRPQSLKPPTEEQMVKETQELKEKIDTFLGNIPKHKVEKKEEKKEEKPEKKQTDTEKQTLKDNAKKASYILGVFSKPVEHDKIWGYQPGKEKEDKEKNEKTKLVEVVEKPKPATTEKPKKRNLWELISVNMKNGEIGKKYSANDLLLQQLTGILVQSEQNPPIPIHSASRALRHTPTFKMRRVVEELMRQRTRYEQQEVERLQQQELGEGDHLLEDEDSGVQHYPPRAWASPTKQLEQES